MALSCSCDFGDELSITNIRVRRAPEEDRFIPDEHWLVKELSPEDMADGDGCPTNGWFTAESSFDYDCVYERVNHTILAFATLPDADTVMAELEPLS